MSQAFLDAEMALFKAQAKEVDVIITTALIPGRPAPKLILQEHVDVMRPGSVTVDLAAEAGGNIATTRPGEVYTTPNGVTCIGYTDMPSRMAPQASLLFGNNVTKFLLSLVPPKGARGESPMFGVDLEDEVTRGALVTLGGQVAWPAPPPPSMQQVDAAAAASVAAAEEEEKSKQLSPAELARQKTMRRAMAIAGAGTAIVAMGAGGADVEFQSSAAVLALSIGLGVWAVRNVAHSLHTPLISATNALSGFTALGGLHLLAADGSLVPYTAAQWLGAVSVFVSTINMVGGSMVTHRMLEMFKRKTDPDEHNQLFAIPAAATVGTYGALALAGLPGAAGTLGLFASVSSIGAIAGLASQDTARMGNALAVIGLGTGTVAAIASLPIAGSIGALTQVAGLMGAGGAAGAAVARSISPMELPQSVAAMHALVGVAAAATSIGTFLAHSGDAAALAAASDAVAEAAKVAADLASHGSGLNTVERVSVFLGAWIGAITATGSVAAFAKLQGLVSSKSVTLPGRDVINGSAALLSLAALGAFAAGDPGTASGLAMLAAGTASAGFLGAHVGLGVGGADAPVLLTVLNSYSGWALCAEGFALHNPLLLTVGALIGSSGGFLSLHMCEAMNRSLPSVILGGWGTATSSAAVEGMEDREHVEISTVETAQLIRDSRRVCVVPGYGMAVAQAQHAMAQVHKTLKAQGKRVEFVIHPVAGRMPGQLNVLLAEAGVPYDDVLDMEDMKEEDWADVDVAIVIGANDTVNPAAEEDPKSPIAGMPVIPVWKARRAIVVKRSMGQGYSAVDNPLFYRPEVCSMLLGDASKIANEILKEIGE